MGSLCAVLSLQTFKPSAGYFLIPLHAALPRPGWRVSLHREPECQVGTGEGSKGEWAACKTDG